MGGARSGWAAEGDPAPAACRIYGIEQGNHADSEVFRVDLRRGTETPLGPTHERADLEGLAVHTGDGFLYALSGQQGRLRGHLFRIDARTGELRAVGRVGFDQLRGLAFRPTDETLWAWSPEGLVEVDAETGGGTLRFASDRALDMLAWSPDGQTLYGAHRHQMFALEGGVLTSLPGLPAVLRPVGMTIRPDGQLLVLLEPHGGLLEFAVVEPRSGELVTTFAVPSERDDVRAVTWRIDCGNPSPGGAAPPIVDVDLDRDVACPGEPVGVEVETRHPEGGGNPVHVDVNGTAGDAVVLQFGDPPGTRFVQVTATTFEGHVDSRTLEVRAEFFVRATLDEDDDRTVRVRATARLFEGDTCNTEALVADLDSESIIGPGESFAVGYFIENEVLSGDGDFLDIRVAFTNEQEP